jgi:hypothetical protein
MMFRRSCVASFRLDFVRTLVVKNRAASDVLGIRRSVNHPARIVPGAGCLRQAADSILGMGYERIITYTLASEGGASLRAAGAKPSGSSALLAAACFDRVAVASPAVRLAAPAGTALHCRPGCGKSD